MLNTRVCRPLFRPYDSYDDGAEVQFHVGIVNAKTWKRLRCSFNSFVLHCCSTLLPCCPMHRASDYQECVGRGSSPLAVS